MSLGNIILGLVTIYAIYGLLKCRYMKYEYIL